MLTDTIDDIRDEQPLLGVIRGLASRDSDTQTQPPQSPTTAHISLDIETLSTHKNAVVLSIAATEFDARGVHGEPFLIELDAQPQIDAGRHVSMDTLRFWAGQDTSLFASAISGDEDTVDAIDHLWTWIEDCRWLEDALDADRAINVWVKGPGFDGAVIESLCEDFGVTCPVSYREWRDVRTIEKLANYRPPAFDGAHDPLRDAEEQAKSVIECYRILGLTI